jgi:RNA recognition motif-containing protein
MNTADEADKAVQQFNGVELNGRAITVQEAKGKSFDCEDPNEQEPNEGKTEVLVTLPIKNQALGDELLDSRFCRVKS